MKRSHLFGLMSIALISFVVRSVPFFRYTFWGVDCGEYVYYTQQWVSTGQIYLSIDGWANAYPFFPGIFILGGSVNFAGFYLFEAVQLSPLILSAAVPLMVFLLAHRITNSAKASLASALFLALLAPFVYNFSQPKPETIGFFLMLFIMLLSTMLTYDNRKLLLLMAPASFALIVSHHFSSFFLILFLFGGLCFSVLLRRKLHRADIYRIAFFLFFTTAAISYWLLAAPPFRENRLMNAFGMPSYSILLGPYIGIGLLLLLHRISVKRRMIPSIKLHKENLSRFYLYSMILIISIVIFIAYLYHNPIPGREIELNELGFYYIPLVFLGIFALGSTKIIWAMRDGVHVLGWMTFLLISFSAGVVTGSSSLLPMRQVAFVMLPVSLLFGIGLIRFWSMINPFSKLKKTIVIAVLISFLFAYNVPLMYPSQDMSQGYNEATEWDEMEGGFWLRTNVGEKVAADHRLSASLFAVGNKNLTWVEGNDIYFSSDPHDALEEAHGLHVRYMMWDEKTIQGVTTTDGAHPYPFDTDLLRYYRSNYMLYSGEQTELYIVP